MSNRDITTYRVTELIKSDLIRVVNTRKIIRGAFRVIAKGAKVVKIVD